MDAEERGQLIPDLPEELVLGHVVPRLPWFTRPLCRALSKSWRAVLDTRNAELDLRTRRVQMPALRGLFVILTYDMQFFIRDPDIQPHWRKLPPFDANGRRMFHSASMVASSGMLYVWSRELMNFVLKLDMGCAEWTWKKLFVPYRFDFDATCFNNKIYVRAESFPGSKYGVLVHDMMTDKCRLLEFRNKTHIRVVSKKCGQSNASVEEMYCFESDQLEENAEVLMYDVESDSWRTQEKVPLPVGQWGFRYNFELLNSDCFEPAPERGINIIWLNHNRASFFWFNSTVEKAWVEISYQPVMQRRHLKCIRGSMYGICSKERAKEEDTEKYVDKGGILNPSKNILMKGRVIVASKSVVWEEVHEVSFFSGDNSIDCHTVMA